MAKQKPQTKQTPPIPKKQSASSGGGFSYLLRNIAVAFGVFIIFFLFWHMFANERRLTDLTKQYYELRAANPNSPEVREVGQEAMGLQQEVMGDTSFLKRVMRGYHWAIHDLCLGNLENIEKVKEEMHYSHEDSTEQSLLEAKMKRRVGLYSFIKYINATTPKDAVIFLPYGDAVISNDSKWSFIYEPEWMEYFIYPRLCVTIGDEKAHPDLAKKANYVIIVRGKGYEKLKYDVPMDQRVSEAILPIDSPTYKKNETLQ